MKIVINCIVKFAIFFHISIYIAETEDTAVSVALICIFLSRQLSGSSDAPKSHYVIKLIIFHLKHWFTWLTGFTLTESREA